MEAAMTVNYRKDHVLVAASEFRPGDVDRLNQVLADAGLGRPLQVPVASSGAANQAGLIRLAVDGADPLAIRDVVAAHAQQDGGGSLVVPDFPYSAGTIDKGSFFLADGKKSGHGTAAWLPAPADQMPAKPAWSQSTQHQLIALLDSGVQPHNWLPRGDHPPFVVDATQYGWHAPTLPRPDQQPNLPPHGTHWGHATFLAGLIRMTAPDAQILSMRVMNAAGQVSDDHVAQALTWLAGQHDKIRPDIVLMAFGRRREETDDCGLDCVKTAISALAKQGVKIVASAGNDGSAEPVYPAAFAADPSLSASVVSVGALSSPTQWAPFSDYGPWVKEARKGTNIISVLPETSTGTGMSQVKKDAFNPADMTYSVGGAYAWWSGTSFAAAICAGQRASKLPAGQGLPEPATGP
jgi:hypothetical protein